MYLVCLALLISISTVATPGCASSTPPDGDGGSTEDSGTGGVAGNGGSPGVGGYATGGGGGGITVTPTCGAQYDDCAGDLAKVCAQDCGGIDNVANANCSEGHVEIPGDDKPLCECVEGPCSSVGCVESHDCDWQDVEGDVICQWQCDALCGAGNRSRPAFCLRPGYCECYCLSGGVAVCPP